MSTASTEAFIRCAIPRAEWVIGAGPVALVAWCGVVTVTLWERLSDATAQ